MGKRTKITLKDMDKEKPIKIKKRHLTSKAAELAKEVTPESLEEARKKLIALETSEKMYK